MYFSQQTPLLQDAAGTREGPNTLGGRHSHVLARGAGHGRWHFTLSSGRWHFTISSGRWHFTLSSGRWHFTLSSGRWHFTLSSGRWHFTNSSGRWHFTISSDRWHFTISSGRWHFTLSSGRWHFTLSSGRWHFTISSGRWHFTNSSGRWHFTNGCWAHLTKVLLKTISLPYNWMAGHVIINEWLFIHYHVDIINVTLVRRDPGRWHFTNSSGRLDFTNCYRCYHGDWICADCVCCFLIRWRRTSCCRRWSGWCRTPSPMSSSVRYGHTQRPSVPTQYKNPQVMLDFLKAKMFSFHVNMFSPWRWPQLPTLR